MEEWGLPLKSMETSGASSNWRMPLSLPFGRGLERGVHFFLGGLLRDLEHHVHDRDVRRGHAERHAVELALQFRQHEGHCLGRARRGRDDGHACGARPAEVLVRQVEELLVVGVGVDRVHEAVHDAEVLMDHFGERREAVRGAGGVRDDVVRLADRRCARSRRSRRSHPGPWPERRSGPSWRLR